MATMPSRGQTLPKALSTLLPQVDHLFLFLDRFPQGVPDHPRITALPSQLHGDLRANGKLLGLVHAPDQGIYLTVDDDIAYPPNYVERLVFHLDHLGPRIVAGVHGSQLKRDHFTSYRKNRVIYPRSWEWPHYTPVDILGTCSAAFRLEDLRFDVRDWAITNMVDLNFAIECQKRNLPRFIVPRGRAWLRPLALEQPDSIYAELKKDDSRQTELARKLMAMSDVPPAGSVIDPHLVRN
jgi:hypothetical protein